jgi:RNA polymerase sigma-70 factor, ECF subfamily
MLTTTFTSPCPVSSPSPSISADREQELGLLRSMVAGEAWAWREFQARYERLIFRCITRVTARFSTRVNAEDVREIYATLLMQLLNNDMHKLRSFDPERGNRFGSWIGLLAINATYDHLRSIRRDSNRTSLAEAETLRANEPDPFESFAIREQAHKVKGLLETFSLKDREFMELYFAQGLEPEEVAERMQISVKTVYSKKHKIQSRLETLVQKERLAALVFNLAFLVSAHRDA